MKDDFRRSVEKDIKELYKKMGCACLRFPATFDYPLGDATPYIMYENGKYHYIISERGTEYKRQTTTDYYKLLFWIMDDATFSIAVYWEVNNRIREQDSRRLSFKKQEDLLACIDQSWANKIHAQHAATVKKHPFDDNRGLCVDRIGELREKGYSYNEARRKAEEEYPKLADSNW